MHTTIIDSFEFPYVPHIYVHCILFNFGPLTLPQISPDRPSQPLISFSKFFLPHNKIAKNNS